jgi:DNA segregation ATPase FtsK/SpoIIIE-like protein
MASERVFTEKIKETIPNRLVGALVSKKNSLRLLGEEGGEGLEGKGDMIFKDMERNEKVRVQVSFISSSELES